jgi:hypothetical protein
MIKDRTTRKIWLVYNIYIKKISKKFALNSWKCLSTSLPKTELIKNTKNQAILTKIKKY